jgi:hypothetical protein
VISFYALAFGGLLLAGGTGTGLTFVGCTTTGMLGVAPRDSGIGAGLLNTSVQVGNALGLAGLAALVAVCTIRAAR